MSDQQVRPRHVRPEHINVRGRRRGALLTLLLLAGAVAGQVVLAGPAGAVAPTVKVELRGGQLNVEGSGGIGGTFVTVASTVSVTGARVQPDGRFKVQASNFSAPDCFLTISDSGTPTVTAPIPGCSLTVTPIPVTPAPPTGTCVILPVPPVAITAATSAAVSFQTTGCDTTTGSGATPTPVQWRLVAGAIPTGMSGPTFQGTTGGNISGIPTIPGVYRFSLQVTDQVGATDQENVTVTVNPPA